MQVVINKVTIINPVKASTCISVNPSFLVDPEESVSSVGLVSFSEVKDGDGCNGGGDGDGCNDDGLGVGGDGLGGGDDGCNGGGLGVCGNSGVQALGGPSFVADTGVRVYDTNHAVAP